MKNRFITAIVFVLLNFNCVIIISQTTSISNDLIAQPVPHRTVLFDISDSGVYKPLNWGLDLAWLSEVNILRGIAFMGVENVDIVRSSFTPTAAMVNGELPEEELNELNTRLDIIDLIKPKMDIVLNVDAPTVDDWYRESPANWVQLIEVTAKHHDQRGHNVIAVSPLNEPDYVWNEMGTIEDFYNIAGELKKNPYFDSIRISGGNTLNTDQALVWYNALKDRLDEGNTHQLAGNFNNYANFYQVVRENGDHATNDELHNVMEAMVGVEYGLQTGIWWGTAELARGEFVKASDGRRIGYAEHRSNWTSASVYRSPDNKIQAFGGTSERQAIATSYCFISKDMDVFYDGQGPQRCYTMELPGGTGYQQGQTNAERVVNITWGDDIQPVINGSYVVVNRKSSKVLEIANGSSVNGSNVQQNTYNETKYQQWKVTPVPARIGGDYSYFSIISASNGKSLDISAFSLENGGNVQMWTNLNGSNQQWYLEYTEDGWFYIRSRYSAKCLEVADSSLDEGANIQQWDVDGGTNQHWRFLPVGAEIEFESPGVPENIMAKANAESVLIEWTANQENDIAGYTVFRSDSSGGPYNTIARNIKSASFIDNTATMGGPFYYKVKAVDSSLNSSVYSDEVSALPSGNNDMVAHYKFDGNTRDTSVNLNHSAAYGEIAFTGVVDSGAIYLNGTDAFLQLPSNLVNQEELTIASWIYWKGGSSVQRIFDFSNGQDEYIYLTTGMSFTVKFQGKEQVISAPALTLNEWTHVAVTLGNSGASLFVNGKLVNESDSVKISSSDIKPMLNYIGRSQQKLQLFKGCIDDFRIYNYILTGTDVSGLSEIPHAIATSAAGREITPVSGFSIWPVPAADVIYVNLNSENVSSLTTLSVYTADGRLIFKRHIGFNTTEINISELPIGVYTVVLTGNNEIHTKKLIINR